MPSIVTPFFAPVMPSFIQGTGTKLVEAHGLVESNEGLAAVLIKALKNLKENDFEVYEAHLKNFKALDEKNLAYKLLEKIPENDRPALQAGDEIIINASGIDYKSSTRKTTLYNFPKIEKEHETKLATKSVEVKAFKPNTETKFPMVEFDSDKAELKFSFSPQDLRQPKIQKAYYENFLADLKSAKEAGLSQKQVSEKLFGDSKLNRMFTYSDSYATDNVNNPLRQSDNTRWQQVAAYYTAFAPEAKVTEANILPFAGFTTQALPPKDKLNENHANALDIFYSTEVQNPKIHALQAGVVVAAGNDWQSGKGSGLGNRSGNGLIIFSPVFSKEDKYLGGIITHHYHLKDLISVDDPKKEIKVGDIVEAGDIIGHGGTTGSNAMNSAPHLHFAVHTVKNIDNEIKSQHLATNSADLFDLFIEGDKKTTLSKIFEKYTEAKEVAAQ